MDKMTTIKATMAKSEKTSSESEPCAMAEAMSIALESTMAKARAITLS